MARYAAEFQETISYSVYVEADSAEEAAKKAQDMLTAGDLVDIESQSFDTETLDLDFNQIYAIVDDNGIHQTVNQ